MTPSCGRARWLRHHARSAYLAAGGSRPPRSATLFYLYSKRATDEEVRSGASL